MKNKMCEITITLDNYSPEEVVLKLAEYVNDGFRINISRLSCKSYTGHEYEFELVKYGE